MSKPFIPQVDTSPEQYLVFRGVCQRCRQSLARLDPKDPMFESIATLCMMARREMERQAALLPF